MVPSHASKSKPVLFLDFLLLVLLFLVVLLGTYFYSVRLSRTSGYDLTKIPSKVDPFGKVGSE